MEMLVAGIPSRWTLRRAAVSAAILSGLAVFLYFVVRYVPQYFVVAEASYGPYFWPRAQWLLPHVVLSLLAITVGPLQLWPRIRERHWRFHRLAGRVYLVGVAGGSIAAIGLSLTAGFTPPYRSGLFFLALAWMATTAMAFAAIRRRKIAQHREWMTRSYVVTFAFVTFRMVRDYRGRQWTRDLRRDAGRHGLGMLGRAAPRHRDGASGPGHLLDIREP